MNKLSRAQIEQRRLAGSVSSEAKAASGRIGGESRTLRKRRAARQNGKRGGRRANPAIKRIMRKRNVSRQQAWLIWKRKGGT